MPVVGTDLGVVKKDTQGKGFATVIDSNKIANVFLLNQKLELEKKKLANKKKEEAGKGYSKALELKEDVFVGHSASIQKKLETLTDEAANLADKGLDVNKDFSNPEVQKFIKETQKLKRLAKLSQQVKTEYANYKAIIDDDDLENKEEIVSYFEKDIDEISEKGLAPPPPKFGKYEQSILQFNQGIVKSWKATNVEPPKDSDISTITDQLFSSKDVKSKKTLQQYRQYFDNMSDEVKERYEKEAVKEGVEPFKLFVEQSIKDSFQPGLMKTLFEDGLKKLKIKHGSKYDYLPEENINREVDYMLAGRDAAVMRDVDSGIYGDPDASIEENRKAAKAYYKAKFKAAITTGVRKSSNSGNGSNGVSPDASNWWNRLTKGTVSQKQAAVDYLGHEGLKKLLAGKVPKSSEVQSWEVTPDGKKIKVVIASPSLMALKKMQENMAQGKPETEGIEESELTALEQSYEISFDEISDDNVIGKNSALGVYSKMVKTNKYSYQDPNVKSEPEETPFMLDELLKDNN